MGNAMTPQFTQDVSAHLRLFNVGGSTFMRYLITTKEVKSPFLTKWFEPENNFNPDIEMIAYDLVECKFTTDGKTWHDIEIDHL